MLRQRTALAAFAACVLLIAEPPHAGAQIDTATTEVSTTLPAQATARQGPFILVQAGPAAREEAPDPAPSSGDKISEILQVVLNFLWLFFVAVLIYCFRKSISKVIRSIVELMRNVAKNANRVKAGVFEFELSKETVAKVHGAFKGAFAELISQARTEYDLRAVNNEVSAILEEFVVTTLPEALRAKTLPPDPKGLRATVHVHDAVFGQHLYQLVDYWPKSTPSKAGRRFSHRYGIIGRAWRMKRSLGVAEATKDSMQLIREWGMTEEEAAAGPSGYDSCVCVLLKSDDGVRQGVLFVDATPKGAFGADDKAAEAFAKDMESNKQVKSLIAAVAQTNKDVQGIASRLQIAS